MFHRATGPSLASGDDRAAALGGVSVRFGPKVVLDRISLEVMVGSHVEVRGQNGSGKTTLLRVLAGTCPPNDGHVAAVRPVAYVPAALEPPALSVRAWLTSIRERRSPVDEALEVLGFRGDLARSFRRLSYGNLRKTLLADALTATANLVVVDEAREGLDDPGLAGLVELIDRARRAGAAVVIADQAAHPVPAGVRTLVVDGGDVAEVGALEGDVHADATETTVTFRGPRSRRSALEQQAARLGYERVPDEMSSPQSTVRRTQDEA